MEGKMAGTISRGQVDSRWIVGHEHALLIIEFPDEDLVHSQIHGEDEMPGRIGLDHMGMRQIVSTEGEASWRCIRRLLRSDRACAFLYVTGISEFAVRQNGKHRHCAAHI